MATAKGGTKKTAAKKSTVEASTVKGSMTVAAKKRSVKRPAAKGGEEDNYTEPALREKIKAEVLAGDKGGRPGQWSARKAQLVAHEYVAEGGGYKHERTEAQEHLKKWGEEKWHTVDGEEAIQGDTTHRYLPDRAWKELTSAEREATEEKKVRGSRAGKQFVPNTDKAKQARKHAEKK